MFGLVALVSRSERRKEMAALILHSLPRCSETCRYLQTSRQVKATRLGVQLSQAGGRMPGHAALELGMAGALNRLNLTVTYICRLATISH